jgi:hypothetical protein
MNSYKECDKFVTSHREFQTREELVKFLDLPSTKVVYQLCSWQESPANHITELNLIGSTYRCKMINTLRFDAAEGHNYVNDLQNSPAKGVFSTEEKAEKYLAMAQAVYAVNKAWQGKVADNKEESDRWDDHYFGFDYVSGRPYV